MDTEIDIESTHFKETACLLEFCEDNSLGPTWSEGISGYTWVSVKPLSLYVLSWRAGALYEALFKMQPECMGFWVSAPHVEFA